MAWQNRKTAPIDGTIILGLFERHDRRAIAMEAAYDPDVEDFRPLSDEDEFVGRMRSWMPLRLRALASEDRAE